MTNTMHIFEAGKAEVKIITGSKYNKRLFENDLFLVREGEDGGVSILGVEGKSEKVQVDIKVGESEQTVATAFTGRDTLVMIGPGVNVEVKPFVGRAPTVRIRIDK